MLKKKQIFKLVITAAIVVTIAVGLYLKREAGERRSLSNSQEDPVERAKKRGLPVIAEFGRGI